MGKNWVRKHKKEFYYRSAKREGYRARSAFKLININKKFKIFKNVFSLLDLGCAPGSWLQVSMGFIEINLKNSKKKNKPKILGVDLKKITPIEGIDFLQMDIHDKMLEQKLDEFFQEKKIDLIISDCSIKKTGNKTLDQVSQIKICNRVLEISTNLLIKNHFLVLKCFEGSELPKFLKVVKDKFQKVNKFIPEATRSRSNEVYLVCKSLLN